MTRERGTSFIAVERGIPIVGPPVTFQLIHAESNVVELRSASVHEGILACGMHEEILVWSFDNSVLEDM